MTIVDGTVDATTYTVAGAIGGEELVHGDLPGRDIAGQHSSDAVTYDGDTLTEYLDNLETGGGGADHAVNIFASDFDAAGGSFTDVPVLGVGNIPRAFVVAATVLVTAGDDFGLWTITASGPCTAGAVLQAGDVVVSTLGQHAVGASASGAGAATSVLITATAADVDAVEADLSAQVIRQRMAEQADRVDPPTKWAVCGVDGYDDIWTAGFQIPSPTSTLTIETWARIYGPVRADGFVEHIAESLDGTGDVDRFEVATWLRDADADDVVDEALMYAEGTAVGATTEWHRPPNAQQDNGSTAPTAIGPWVRMLWVYDFDAHTITTYYEDDIYFDHEWHSRNWATIGTYTNPGITSLRATEGEPTWIGRSVAEYEQAHIHIWCDDVEVLRFDPTTADIGDTTVLDSVAEDGLGDPIEWVGTGSAVIAGPAAGGGGVELGETSTTAYRGDRGKTAYDHSQVATGNPHGTTVTDLGAVPTSRTISAGTGLTGGGDLSANRTLAVTYGLAASTAAEGIAIANTPWRAGSFYGTGFTVSNAGTNVASGQVKAMPFFNPVAGRQADRIAIDVHTGSAGSGILYICTDDGNGYPGAVVASGAMSAPTSTTRSTATISYTLPRGLLWLVCHGTGTTWAALTLGNQSIYMPSPAAYSANAINCWNATGAGTSTLTAFPAGASLGALNGVQILLRAA